MKGSNEPGMGVSVDGETGIYSNRDNECADENLACDISSLDLLLIGDMVEGVAAGEGCLGERDRGARPVVPLARGMVTDR